MSIHKLVEEALLTIGQYEVPTKDKYEMIYCCGRIEASLGYDQAAITLNQHLNQHYTLKDEPKVFVYEV